MSSIEALIPTQSEEVSTLLIKIVSQIYTVKDKVSEGFGLNLVNVLESILTFWTCLRP